MPLREPCEHGRWEAHDWRVSGIKWGDCPGGRVLSDAEALRALLFDGDEPRDGVARASHCWNHHADAEGDEMCDFSYPDDPCRVENVVILSASMLEGDKTDD